MKKASDRPIRILVIDDHPVVRDGLAAILEQEHDFEVVGQAADGQQGVDLWRGLRPDVTLMDLRIPVLDGVDAIYAIRAIEPTARIVVLTTFDSDEDIYRGLRAGARAYLLKDTQRKELVGCIREVHAGRTVLPPSIAEKLARRLPSEELTRRETEVLQSVAAGKSNKMIAAALGVTEVTVKSHLHSLFRKLNVLSRTEAIAVATRRGLLHT